MIISIRCLGIQLLCFFVSGRCADDTQASLPTQQDYTFVLVHNLSEITDWNAFLANPSQYYNPSTHNPGRPPMQWPPPIPGVQRPPRPPPTYQKPPNSRPPKPGYNKPPSYRPPKPPGYQKPKPLVNRPLPGTAPAMPAVTTTETEGQSTSESQCGVRGDKQGLRIVGGTDASPAEFPWQVSLQLKLSATRRPLHICGGAVLSHYWVVTAAHCVWELTPAKLSVVAGDYDLYVAEGHEQRSAVSRIVTGKYRRESFTNDIALLQLKTPLNIDHKWISPVCLPKPGQQFLKGDSVVSGWGRLSETGALPHVLQYVTLPILNTRRCQDLYRKAGFARFINRCQLCSGYEQGGQDSCQGDSGGPLTCPLPDGRYYLCGVVSWGYGCARPLFPGVYTEISCHTDWIKQIVYNEDNVLAYAPAVANIASRSPGLRNLTYTLDTDDLNVITP